jgi:chemotaxis protein CheX
MSDPAALPTKRLRLGKTLDLRVAALLQGELLEARGRPVEVDASQVEQIGALCLQVLLAARNTWSADNVALRVTASSPEFDQGLALLGANAAQLSTDAGSIP